MPKGAFALRGVCFLSVATFDVTNTLIKPSGGSVGSQYATAALRLAGWRLDAVSLQRAFVAQLGAQRKRYPLYGRQEGLDGRRWWGEVVKKTLIEGSREYKTFAAADEAMLDQIADHLYDSFEWEVFPHADALLVGLKAAGIGLVVVSNSDDRLRGILDSLGIGGAFDLVLTSHETGFEKPDPRMFDAALRPFGADPTEAVHVGDDVVKDFAAAKRRGMHAYLVDHRVRLTEEEAKAAGFAGFVSRDLEELSAMMQRTFRTKADDL